MVKGLKIENFDSALFGKLEDDYKYRCNSITMFGKEYQQLRVRNIIKTLLGYISNENKDILRRAIVNRFNVRPANVSGPIEVLIDDVIIDNDIFRYAPDKGRSIEYIITTLMKGVDDELSLALKTLIQ